MTFKIESSAFAPETAIPRRYTCEGVDVSPPLSWTGVPVGTRSLALVVEDPDAPDPQAPVRTWVHWVVFGIPPTARGLVEGAAETALLPPGAEQGTNSWKQRSYGGPCPPIGRHRYYFRLFALDTILQAGAPTSEALQAAMEGHVLGTCVLMGTYEKRR